ncbi:CbiQ family ECF transporter T component [Caenispirillum salinarum]|uniref:CbiQ family ECF transporter T component n=1 Tax=Caenispirillum salinarum TaxID=859058 RepID=UPI00384B05F3
MGGVIARGGILPLHRVPAGWKLLALAASSAGLFLSADPLVLAGAFTAVLVLAWAAGALAVVTDLRPLALVLVLSFAAHAVLGDWRLGLAIVLRVGALVSLAGVVTATTPFGEMLGVLDRLLAPLRWMGVQTRPVSVAIGMTLRFVPVLSLRWRTLRDAWTARSARRPGWRLLVPFVVGVLNDADRAAEALAARGAFLEKRP